MADKKPASANDLLDGNTAPQPLNSEELAQKYDLLPHMIPFFDRHLVYPLLQSAFADDIDSPEATKVIFELLRHTNMIDFVGELHKTIEGRNDRAPEYARRREEVMKKREKYHEDTSKIMGLLEDQDVVSNLRSDKVANLNYLKEQHGVTIEMVNGLYEMGQFQYSCGDYASAADTLYQFRILSTDNEKVAASTWGRLACEVLNTEWEGAMEEVQKLRENIDTRLFNNPLSQLQQRTWLIHWCLFPFFNFEPARDTLTEMFYSPTYINTIQTNCPWILRYLGATVITNRNRTKNTGAYQKQLKDLVRIVRQEEYEYRDPVTDFIKALYLDFDFVEAQHKLLEAEEILRSDFFLAASADAFVDSARHLISEAYCKIHQRIDIKDLSTRLGLSQDEGEKWIVNLIRDTRVDAKIDYTQGTVVMNHPPQSVYQQIIERTKGGFFRTQVLSAAVAK